MDWSSNNNGLRSIKHILEHTKKMKEETYRKIMIGGLYLGIILFLLAIISLSKNIEEIRTDPIIYGMEKHQFNSCTCYDLNGRFTKIDLEDFQPTISIWKEPSKIYVIDNPLGG